MHMNVFDFLCINSKMHFGVSKTVPPGGEKVPEIVAQEIQPWTIMLLLRNYSNGHDLIGFQI
jgi:hypothetical protein